MSGDAIYTVPYREAFEMNDNMCYSSISAVEKKKRLKAKDNKSARKSAITPLMVTTVLVTTAVTISLLMLAAFSVHFWLKISELESGSVHQQQSLTNHLDKLDTFGNQVNSSFDTFFGSLVQRVTDLKHQTQQIIDGLGRPGEYLAFPALSCVSLSSSSPSGYYWVRATNGSAVRVYCDMTRSCGNAIGGWVRVANLDMTNSSHQCPSGLRQRTNSNLRTCVKNMDSPGCSAVQYSTASIRYSRVCGKITAYQFNTTDAFAFSHRTGSNISTTYVDGVSLTHGHPREHIWTFASAFDELGGAPSDSCRCIRSDAPAPPSFVGMDYFCDTGRVRYTPGVPSPPIFSDDPLWDGAGCGTPNNCCSFNTPPWFYKQLPRPTTDDIEMRVCRDEDVQNEDVAIVKVEIYIR